MSIIVYPGTFDPLTNGHVDLLERAAKLFDHLIIAVAIAKHKKTLFSLDDRLAMVKATVGQNPKITVCTLDGLLIDFVKRKQASGVLRGLRTAADFEYEFQLAGMNRGLAPDIETLFMTPSQETLFISATLIREIILFKGDVARFVPKAVMEYIQHVT